MGLELLDDAERNAASLDIVRAVAGLSSPLLIVHGDQDVSVSVDEAHALDRREQLLRHAAEIEERVLKAVYQRRHVLPRKEPAPEQPRVAEVAVHVAQARVDPQGRGIGFGR